MIDKNDNYMLLILFANLFLGLFLGWRALTDLFITCIATGSKQRKITIKRGWGNPAFLCL